MKHLGQLKTTGNKVVIVNRTLPGDAMSSLVIDKDALRPFESDHVMDLLESANGQNAFEFAHELGRVRMELSDSLDTSEASAANSVTGITVLEHLHNKGLLMKQPTENVLVTDGTADAIQLDKLNEIIAEQKGVRVDGLAIQADTNNQGDSNKTEAKLMLNRANKLEEQMNAMRERAYELQPELRPKKGRPKKSAE